MIITGDSLQELKKLPENSIDSCVTDPPYGISFMNSGWDYDVPTKELWIEVLRVLKPGGYLLSFAGTRTQHRMAVNIEDAGFEIRDIVAWVYSSGFPKSHNIGKAVDKIQGNEREESPNPLAKQQTASKEGTIHGSRPHNTHITKGTSPYEGWGTNLKPALEPITVARKPLSEKTVATNVLKWNTGGINIDGSRVGSEQIEKGIDGRVSKQFDGIYGDFDGHNAEGGTSTGRFPANFIHDGSDEVVGLFPDSKGQGKHKKADYNANQPITMGGGQVNTSYTDKGSAARFFKTIPLETGEGKRFVYTAKASKSERNKGLEGFEAKEVGRNQSSLDGGKILTGSGNERSNTKINNHPTVKPVELMRYLVKLVTPAGGTVLDPFNGSGTTGIACKLENFNYVGIELDPEYVKLSEARIEAWGNEPEQQELL